MMLLARLFAQSRFTPGRHRRFPANGSASFAAAVRVIIWIHNHAADGWPQPQPTVTARLAQVDILMIKIAHLANTRPALHAHHAHLA